VKYLTRSKK